MRKTIVLAAALLYVPVAGAVYKCVDEKGITRIGETPPAECEKVVMYEVKPSGQVIRKIDPTPTAEQLQRMKEENDRKRAEEKVAAEQKRRDSALLNTYANEREFEVARERNIDPIRGRIHASEDRLKAIEAREKKIQEDMEFYKSGKKKNAKAGAKADEPPPMLVAEQEKLAKERESIIASMAAQEKEIEALKVRFESDRRRWVELKSGAVAKPVEGPKGPTTVTLSAGGAGRAKCGDKVYECPAGESYICTEQDPGTLRRRTYKVNCVVERK